MCVALILIKGRRWKLQRSRIGLRRGKTRSLHGQKWGTVDMSVARQGLRCFENVQMKLKRRDRSERYWMFVTLWFFYSVNIKIIMPLKTFLYVWMLSFIIIFYFHHFFLNVLQVALFSLGMAGLHIIDWIIVGGDVDFTAFVSPVVTLVRLLQGGGGSAGAGQGVGAVRWILPRRGVLPEGEGRLQQCPDGEVLDEGKGPGRTVRFIAWKGLKGNHWTMLIIDSSLRTAVLRPGVIRWFMRKQEKIFTCY